MKSARSLATALALTLVLVGCSNTPDEVTKDACTEASAREVKQAMITNDAFEVPCAKVRVNTQFFFINNDETVHTATSSPNAAEPFDAELPKKGSTYAHTFTKAGEYVISRKRHQESMALFVIA